MLTQQFKRLLKALNATNSCQLSVTSFQLRVTLWQSRLLYPLQKPSLTDFFN